MTPLAARSCLVGTAVVLAIVGVFGALPGVDRLVLLLAAAVCAFLDVALARSLAELRADGVPVVLVDPVRSHQPRGPARSEGDPARSEGDPARSEGDPALSEGDPALSEGDSAPSEGDPAVRDGLRAFPGLMLGRRADGRPVHVGRDPERTCHVVVVGVGAMAEALFTALRAQLDPLGDEHGPGRSVQPDLPGLPDLPDPPIPHDPHAPHPPHAPRDEPGVELRAATGPQLVSSAEADVPGLPPATAVAVRLGATGAPRTTVVLVPGLHLLPRRWDHLVEVTRHGCRVQHHLAGPPVHIDPVLPLLR